MTDKIETKDAKQQAAPDVVVADTPDLEGQPDTDAGSWGSEPGLDDVDRKLFDQLFSDDEAPVDAQDDPGASQSQDGVAPQAKPVDEPKALQEAQDASGDVQGLSSKEMLEVNRRLRDLARREKALEDKEKALKTQDRAPSRPAPASNDKVRALTDPVSYIKDVTGMEPIEYLEHVAARLNGQPGKLSPEQVASLSAASIKDEVLTEVASLREELRKKEEAIILQQQNQQIEAIKSSVVDRVKANPSFELINRKGQQAQAIVYDMIAQHWNDTGEVLKVEDAAQALEDAMANEIEKLTGFHPKKAKAVPAPVQQQQPKRVAVTNASETSPGGWSSSQSDDDDAELRADVMKFLKGM